MSSRNEALGACVNDDVNLPEIALIPYGLWL